MCYRSLLNPSCPKVDRPRLASKLACRYRQREWRLLANAYGAGCHLWRRAILQASEWRRKRALTVSLTRWRFGAGETATASTLGMLSHLASSCCNTTILACNAWLVAVRKPKQACRSCAAPLHVLSTTQPHIQQAWHVRAPETKRRRTLSLVRCRGGMVVGPSSGAAVTRGKKS